MRLALIPVIVTFCIDMEILKSYYEGQFLIYL